MEVAGALDERLAAVQHRATRLSLLWDHVRGTIDALNTLLIEPIGGKEVRRRACTPEILIAA